MQAPTSKMLTVVLAAIMALATLDAAAAKTRKHRTRTAPEAAFWRGVVPTENGTPVIMKGYHPPAPPKQEEPRQRADGPVKIPRGSSTYIPPVNPAPNYSGYPSAASGMPAPPTVQPYNPPPITTFSDRVTGAIHAFPLERGLGNNPNDLQGFIRQRVNQ
jgi:hypothetical protein